MDLFCVGPIARYVEDVALVLPVIAGPDWIDPYAVPAPLGDPGAVALDGLRVGWFADDPRLAVPRETRDALAAACAALADAGARRVRGARPVGRGPDRAVLRLRRRRRWRPVARRRRHRRRARAAVPGADRCRRALAAQPPPTGLPSSAACSRCAPAFASWPRRSTCCCARSCRARRRGTASRPGRRPPSGDDPYRAFDYVHLLALGGLPAASVPAGSQDGLPLGVQVAAAPFREDRLLAAAAAIEPRLRPGGAMSDAPALRALGVHKSYGGVHALRGVDLELRPGEIHGLIGENGSGKSTLLKIIAGQLEADSGRLVLDGRDVRFANAARAMAAGIATVTQETTLVRELSVAENIFLGPRKARRPWGIDWRRTRAEALAILERLGLEIDPSVAVGQLRPDQQQMVEIARALSIVARVVILDEPTSSLPDDQVASLFESVRALRDHGVAVVFVSHRMNEIFDHRRPRDDPPRRPRRRRRPDRRVRSSAADPPDDRARARGARPRAARAATRGRRRAARARVQRPRPRP